MKNFSVVRQLLSLTAAALVLHHAPSIAEQRCGTAAYPATPVVAAGDYTLTLNIVDIGLAQPTAARIGVFTDAGVAVAPSPAADYLFQSMGVASYFYGDGSAILQVPAGDYVIYAVKGFEYEPVTINLSVSADTQADVALQRWTDSKPNRWYNGDTHTHMTHAPVNYALAPEDLLRVMHAEDLHYLNAMEDEVMFTGGAHALSESDRILYFSKEHRNPHFGHLTLLGLKQWIVTETCPVVPGRACGRTLNEAIAEQVHQQNGALVIATHPRPPGSSYDDVSAWPGGGIARGLPLDVIDDAVDAVDILCYTHEAPPAGLDTHMNILNAGLKLPPSAGSDAILSAGNSPPPGGYRVYVKVADQLDDSDDFADALQAGRCFVTNYPLIHFFSLEGKSAGETLVTLSNSASGWVYVRCALPFEKVEIIADGQVTHTFTPDGAGTSLLESYSLQLETVQWVMVRVTGSVAGWHAIDVAGQLFAQSGPIYVDKQNRDPLSIEVQQRAAADRFRDELNEMDNFFDAFGDFPDSSRAAYDAAQDRARLFYDGLVPDAPDSFTLDMGPPMFYSQVLGEMVSPVVTPLLRWQEAVDNDPGDIVTYDVYFGRMADFSDAVIRAGITATEYQVLPGEALVAGDLYYWKVEARDQSGRSTVAGPAQFVAQPLATGIGNMPTKASWALAAPSPNPFNPSVVIRYSVPVGDGRFTLHIFDVAGRRVRTLFDGRQNAGSHSLQWNGRDDDGALVASGVYLVTLSTPSQRWTRKITYLK